MNRAVRGGEVYRTDDTVANPADGIDEKGRQIISGGIATQAIVITVDADIEPTAGITAAVDTDATVLFAGDTEPVAVKLLGGIVYPYSVKKVTVGADIVGLY